MGKWRYLIVGAALFGAAVVFNWPPALIKFGGFNPASFIQLASHGQRCSDRGLFADE